jgi:hypothetical protein
MPDTRVVTAIKYDFTAGNSTNNYIHVGTTAKGKVIPVLN